MLRDPSRPGVRTPVARTRLISYSPGASKVRCNPEESSVTPSTQLWEASWSRDTVMMSRRGPVETEPGLGRAGVHDDRRLATAKSEGGVTVPGDIHTHSLRSR